MLKHKKLLTTVRNVIYCVVDWFNQIEIVLKILRPNPDWTHEGKSTFTKQIAWKKLYRKYSLSDDQAYEFRNVSHLYRDRTSEEKFSIYQI